VINVEYDGYLSNYYGHVSPPSTLEWNAISALQHHGPHFPSDKNAAILEIGPGFGSMMHALHHRRGYQKIKGIDISPEVVEWCNEVLPGSTELVADTSEFLKKHPEEFDCIIMLHVLEHVPKEHLISLLHTIRVALRPGGKLIVEVPNAAHPVAGVKNRYADFTHTVGFTDQSLRFVLRSAGFSEVSVYGCKILRKSLARIVQRTAQDTVELFLGLLLRLYMPTQPIVLASLLGACATK
jgi:2-polyprenyl-3-methyl-5-hydroxy-6-metoxy-1,4-benzoquinol methylase